MGAVLFVAGVILAQSETDVTDPVSLAPVSAAYLGALILVPAALVAAGVGLRRQERLRDGAREATRRAHDFAREHPEDLNWTLGPGQVVAAAAVVAAGLPAGEAFLREITEQDYENLANVQQGMRSAGWAGPRLNPRQEGNILHMHRVIDSYLGDGGPNHE